jgi:hypothetical protein
MSANLYCIQREKAERLRKIAAILGRQGGLKRGRVRAQRLSPQRQREIAQQAARARRNNRTKESRKSPPSTP